MTASDSAVSAELETRLRRIVALHFDPEGGSAYWLGKAGELGFDPREEIRTIDDLSKFGPMDAEALATLPIEAFIPASLSARRTELVVAETGGTSGTPKFAVHRMDEWAAAFVEPFVRAAHRAAFPKGGAWLFVGPTGPHVIGKAARACAEAMGAPDPFTVDFDPRWARKLPPDSFARKRYVLHIEDQAMHVLSVQDITVLFSTPPVLESLSQRMPAAKRAGVLGLHLGGMAISNEQRQSLACSFPHAVILSGYGNTLFGMAPELAFSGDHGISYYPHGTRMLIRVVEYDLAGDTASLDRVVAYGERGRIVVHRLDETQFIANMVERDTAVRLAPVTAAGDDGFVLDGIRDPQPLVLPTTAPAAGLY